MESTRETNGLTIVTFDTSVPNRLVADGEVESVVPVIRSQRYIRLAGDSIAELASTSNVNTREALFRCYESLTEDNALSDCLLPQSALIATLVQEHHNNPWSFDWRSVDIRSQDYYDEIRKREHVMDDELSADQREEQKALQKRYRKLFTQQRPAYDAAYAASNEPRPTTFHEALMLTETGDRRRTITSGQGLYQRVTGTNISREAVREFISACPPFRALIYTTLMSEFDLAHRDKHRGERFEAGRNDLAMAIYLPYCHEFVTAEVHGEQERCLREIALRAEIQTEVLSYDDFLKRLTLI